ncbi:MAG: hypothetical protein R6V44_00205 [Paracoccaceae bacterium]
MPRLAAVLIALAAATPAAFAAGPDGPGWAVAPEGAALRDAPGGETVREVAPADILTATEETAEQGGTLWRRLSQGDGPDLWVEEAALEPAPLATFPGSDMPVAGICAGTEPFWSAAWDETSMAVRLGRGEAEDRPASAATPEGWRHGVLLAEGLTLVFEARACPYSPVDGLVWGRGALVETDGARRVLLGCCRPLPPALR